MHHLPERDRPPIKARLRRAWAETDYHRALEQLQRLADELDHTHPGAAGSLREGMEETLTVTRLRIKGKLKRTLESTNPCESMIDTVRTTQRNVKNWSSGEMGLRWTSAGMLEAEKQFRKVIGYLDLPRLAVAIERRLHLPQPNHLTTQETAIAVTAWATFGAVMAETTAVLERTDQAELVQALDSLSEATRLLADRLR